MVSVSAFWHIWLEVIDMLDMTSYVNKQEIKSDAINLVYRK